MNSARAIHPHQGQYSDNSPTAIYGFAKKGLKSIGVNKNKEITQPISKQNMPSDPAKKRKNEIISLSNDLKEFGLTFLCLSSNSPKNEDDKRLALSIANKLVEDSGYRSYFMNIKQLPVSITEQLNVSNAFVNKNRSYIIGISLLMLGNYENLQNYLLKGGA